MSILVTDCPRCGAKEMSFDVCNTVITRVEQKWRHYAEVFCVCRNCSRSTIFTLSQHSGLHEAFFKQGLQTLNTTINSYVNIDGYIAIKDIGQSPPPEHLPEAINNCFLEGSTCLSVGCFNAAGTMFRLCIDLATKSMLPDQDEDGLNNKIRRNLGLRLPWLFDNNILPETLRELSDCIKDDGNDGAHDGTLTKEDAQDICDFTFVLLERLYTEPERLKKAKERREARHNKS